MLSIDPPNLLVGGAFTLTVSIVDQNLSFRDADEFISGLLPSFTIESIDASAGTCTQGQTGYTCDIGAFSAGNSVTFTVRGVASTAGTFQISASGASGSATQLSVTVANPTADLAVRLPAATLRPKLGQTERVGILVTNNGPIGVTAAQLALALPAQTKLAHAVTDGAGCSGIPLVCSLGSLAPSASTLIVLTLAATKPGTGHLTATTNSEVTDGVQGNNMGSETVIVPKPKPKPEARR
jgi:hypothetical protein